MITKIQLQRGATILAEDGKKIGTLERVVVNPATNVITDVVVRAGGLFSQEEKVVPVELIVETAGDKILMHEAAGDLTDFPPFEEDRIVDEKGNKVASSSEGSLPPIVIGFPVPASPVMQVPGGKIVTRKEKNIPDGTVAMKEGAAVISADDKQVGKVESVLAEPLMDQITHFVISSGLLAMESKLIPIRWVMRVGEDAIHLRMEKSDVENLVEEPVAG